MSELLDVAASDFGQFHSRKVDLFCANQTPDVSID